MHALLMFLALCAGTFIPLQMGMNALLTLHWSKSAPLSSLFSFFLGTVALGILILVSRTPLPSLTSSTAPWYAWIGGLLGAVIVTTLTYLAPRIGALAMMSLLICGQLLASIIFDHYGLVGYPLRPVTVMRIIGVVLLICGVYLINRY
ncbi:DMT family transporter [Halodesulfovibrio spirochaetisodalis]|uniref:Membrane protein n=1 Tax=Halodesulfovibrio spirochaetisodalis TaxID=1560234 RepID=A0A1B7XCZ6_9BACT|nr:DMT family transporter [Halodesulfovibrio spirochaetisodalis]OBQ51869.1 membrane protein [Halodesulfovibrio spirochaetisodalis]